MDATAMLKRINDIFQTDVMSEDKGDFLATHMPFRRLGVHDNGRKSSEEVFMTEEQAYTEIVDNPRLGHRFIVVRGANGSGKSHLIRWLHARMRADLLAAGNGTEKLIFIRRVDNTLRGAMRQLLEQGAVSNSEQSARMERFVSSEETQSERELRDTIYYSFVSLVSSEDDDGVYKKVERGRALSFLSSETVKNYLQKAGGPVDRIYSLITRPRGVGATTPSFLPTDFDGMLGDGAEAFQRDLEHEGNRGAARVYRDLSDDGERRRLCDFLNGYTRRVIRRSAHITQGDADSLIRDLRRQLKAEGKSLTIFIEDLTAFTGVDSELIKVLMIRDGGEYDDLCRITSVIGITDGYYDNLKSNATDRVTHQVKVDEYSFGSDDTLREMAARYINALYLSKDDVDTWLKQGADPRALPYRAYAPGYAWDTAEVDGRDFTIFPFNATALHKLYARMETKTPRFFIKYILQSQLGAFLRAGERLFPSVSSTSLGGDVYAFAHDQHQALFGGFSMADAKAKKRLMALMCLWGDATLYRRDGTLAGLPEAFYAEMGFAELPRGVADAEEATPPPTFLHPVLAPGEEDAARQPDEDKKLREQLSDLDAWYHQGAALTFDEERRGNVCAFIRSGVGWPAEGIPTYWVERRLSSARYVYIEGQTHRTPTKETAVVALERGDETYWLLRGLTYRDYYGHWGFAGASFYQVKCVVWLEARKRELIVRVVGADLSMTAILASYLNVAYIRGALFGLLRQGDTGNDVLTKLLLARDARDKSRDDGWCRSLKLTGAGGESGQAMDEICNAIPALINFVQGGSGKTVSKKYLVARTLLDAAFKLLKERDCDLTSYATELRVDLTSPAPALAGFRWLSEYAPRVRAAAAEELNRVLETVAMAEELVDDPANPESWKAAAKQCDEFLSACNSDYSLPFDPELRKGVQGIAKVAPTLAMYVKSARSLGSERAFDAMLQFLSADPRAALKASCAALKNVETYALQQGDKAEQAIGRIVEDIDTETNERLEAQIDALYEIFREPGGVMA